MAIEETPPIVVEFVNKFGSKHLVIALDTGHVEDAMGELYRAKNHLIHLHVTDVVRPSPDEIDKLIPFYILIYILKERGSVNHLVPFEGEIDWKRFETGLKEIGYKGCFMYEG